MTRYAICHVALTLAAWLGLRAQTVTPQAPDPRTLREWTDSAGHRNGRLAIGGTTIHYIDYGGAGEALVFLAGLGNSAHIFDVFAPRFTDRYHVLAITRRGYGESGRPSDGFGTARLSDDVKEVLDSLGLADAVLAGHSVAGDELTDLAVRYPDRVSGLVYLEAAYDRRGVTGRLMQRMLLGQLPPQLPKPTSAERASFKGYSNYLERLYGVRWPESEVRVTRWFDAAGTFLRDGTPARINFAIARGEIEMAYEHVTAPTLAVYAVNRSVERDYPWIRRMTIGRGKAQLQAEKASRADRSWEAAGRRHLHVAMPRARVVELHDASHYVFISHADTVEREMRAFLERALAPR